jgi:glycosyltransferase involved in cell wall biosynthesis
MHSPHLGTLPPAPPDKTGWPWTEESLRLPETTPDGQKWPRITVITPSFNQGRFIEETIRSILLQGYPNLEYFILDGGSTDNSVEVIKKYSPWISFWVSERDSGQSAAINRGLRIGSGQYATWICSDDLLCKNAFTNHFQTKAFAADVIYIGDCIHIDEAGTPLRTHRGRVHSFEDLVRVNSVWRQQGWIDQSAVLFPLGLALRSGGLDEKDHFSMDYQLWGQLLLEGARIEYTGVPFGIFRWQSQQKTQDETNSMRSMVEAAAKLAARADFWDAETRERILAEIEYCWKAYTEAQWKQSGRLTRIGLPLSLVVPIRKLMCSVEKTVGHFTSNKRVKR